MTLSALCSSTGLLFEQKHGEVASVENQCVEDRENGQFTGVGFNVGTSVIGSVVEVRSIATERVFGP